MAQIVIKTPDGRPIRSKKVRRTIRGMRANTERGLTAAAIHMQSVLKKDWLRGRALNRRTGHLIRSIAYVGPEMGREGLFVKVGTPVKYARVHEYGATIRAKNKPYLVFRIPGVGWISKKSVRIPKRAFIEPSLKENTQKIDSILLRHIGRPLR